MFFYSWIFIIHIFSSLLMVYFPSTKVYTLKYTMYNFKIYCTQKKSPYANMCRRLLLLVDGLAAGTGKVGRRLVGKEHFFRTIQIQ